MDILMPSQDEMSNMKEKMKECLEKEGHTHLSKLLLSSLFIIIIIFF